MAPETPIPVITSYLLKALTTTFTYTADYSSIYQTQGVFFIDLGLLYLPPGTGKQATDYFYLRIACSSSYTSAYYNGICNLTTVICCPFYGCLSLSCVDPATLSDVFATFCSWIAPLTTSLSTTLSTNGSATLTEGVEFVSPATSNASGIELVYESTYLINSTSHANSALSTSWPTRTISTMLPTGSSIPSVPKGAPSASSQTPSISRTSTRSNSTAAISIVVVIPAVALIMLGVAYMLWRKRRQQREPRRSFESSVSLDLFG